ncbi:MAG: beta-propeller fold lactonase family protein [Coriobacteriia bacterium]|nr:beta-propeller fold lactonase family protein [Coriobacteriia bacterium]
MQSQFKKRLAIALAVVMASSVLLLPTVALARGHGKDHHKKDHFVGAVYVQTNEVSNNIAVFLRRADGSLKPGGTVSTGGSGTGSGLGSQGAVILSENGKWLFAVNAGSNDISVFSVRDKGLKWVDRVPSVGTMPISVAVHDKWVYVLDAGGSGNIAGFRVDKHGHLSPIAGSVQPLSNLGVGVAPVAEQIGFKPWGGVLVVTEKSTGMIDSYAVNGGVAGPPMVHTSNGAGPYGFDFTNHGKLIVSEAAIGALSSYNVTPTMFSLISGSVPDFQLAPCWVVCSPDARYAYTSDAHSNDISIYKVKANGALTLGKSAAVTASTPLDLGMPHDGRFLYNLAAGSHNVVAFKVRDHGMLKSIGSFGTLPASASGLVSW